MRGDLAQLVARVLRGNIIRAFFDIFRPSAGNDPMGRSLRCAPVKTYVIQTTQKAAQEPSYFFFFFFFHFNDEMVFANGLARALEAIDDDEDDFLLLLLLCNAKKKRRVKL